MLFALLLLLAHADVICTLHAPGGHCDSGLVPVETWNGRDVSVELAGGPVRIVCPDLGMAAYLTSNADGLSLLLTDRADNVLAQDSGVPPLAARAVNWFDQEIALSCVDSAERADVRLPERVLFAVEAPTLDQPSEVATVAPREVRAEPAPRARQARNPAPATARVTKPAPRPEPAPTRPRVVVPKPRRLPAPIRLQPRRAPPPKVPRPKAAPVAPVETDGNQEAPAHDIY